MTDPVTVVAGITAALRLLELLTPVYEGMVARGEISKEQQVKDRAAFDALRGREAFGGEAWKKSGRVKALSARAPYQARARYQGRKA